jgi:hypothetical protein
MRRFSLFVKTLLATAAALAGTVVLATAASAHVGSISTTCTGVTFSFSGFPDSGGTIDESVTINGTTTSTTFDLTSSSGSNTIAINGMNGDVVSAQATWTVGGGGSASAGPVKLSGCQAPPPCPPGTSIHVRWHYSANGSSGSWSATTAFTCPGQVSMGPQAMEGNLKVADGGTVKAGFDFTIPGDNNPVTVTFTDPEVTFNDLVCANGSTPAQTTLTTSPVSPLTYTSTNGGDWFPSGVQSSSLVYQLSLTVPSNECPSGVDVSFQKGGTFTATIS